MPYRRHSSPSLLLNLPLLILLLSVVVFLLFIFFAISSSSSSHAKLRPATVKKSWDSLNVFLVLFAVLCGIFARKNDDDHSAPADDAHNFNRNVLRGKEERRTVSNNWFDQFTVATPATGGMRRLKRSSSSYPDLRNESFWESGDDRSRFFDDFEISKYRSFSSLSGYVYDRRQRSGFEESVDVKEIPVDTCVLRSSLHSPSPPLPKSPTPPPPPPPPPPSATSNQKQMRTFKTVQRKEKIEKPGENEYEFSRKGNSPPKPPPPPPPPPRFPPPPPVTKATRSGRKHWSKKTNATKELKMALISLYHQSKRKKQLKTRSLYDDTLQSPPELPSFLVPPPSSPPPPPPPPPPPTVFHSLFRKGSKNKRIHSFSAPLPPPPPPPPPRQPFSTLKRWSKRKGQISHPPPPPPPPPAPVTPPQAPFRRQNNTITTGRPPLPTKANNFYDENVNIVGKSTLIPMPPPPPLPPFKVPGFKFMIKGDYVKIRSGHSSRCSSPELEEVDKRSTETVNMMKNEEVRGGSLFCPSPDVNAKADSFIARLRDEWRLEKINSMKSQRNMGLGPEPNPISSPSKEGALGKFCSHLLELLYIECE